MNRVRMNLASADVTVMEDQKLAHYWLDIEFHVGEACRTTFGNWGQVKESCYDSVARKPHCTFATVAHGLVCIGVPIVSLTLLIVNDLQFL